MQSTWPSFISFSIAATFLNRSTYRSPPSKRAPRKARTSSTAELGADHLGAEAEHVHVVVLDALVRGVDVVADRGADPRELAGGDRGADARAADEHAALVAGLDRLAQLARLVRVVDPPRVGVRAQVDVSCPSAAELLEHALAQLHAPVVERHRDVHATRSSRAAARVATFSGVKPRLQHHVARSRRAEAVDRDRGARVADPALPAVRDPRLDREPRRTSGGITSSR